MARSAMSIPKRNNLAAKVSGKVWPAVFWIGCRSPFKQKYDCPLCGYHGAFTSQRNDRRQTIKDGICPGCKSRERHRLQALVLDKLAASQDLSLKRVLHFGPEPGVGRRLGVIGGAYETADIRRTGVDHQVDLRSLPFDDGSYDLVFASHVLEHIQEDLAAIGEIRRVLASGGLALLPVPILGDATIEYPEPREYGHVRAPGLDYFDRYRKVFSRVDVFTSNDFPPVYQTYLKVTGAWPDRWGGMPSFVSTTAYGYAMTDFVPVCYV